MVIKIGTRRKFNEKSFRKTFSSDKKAIVQSRAKIRRKKGALVRIVKSGGSYHLFERDKGLKVTPLWKRK